MNSEGVLLLTNDGRLAHRLLHPRYGISRTYLVQVNGIVSEDNLERLRSGVGLDDGKTLPAQVQVARRAEQSCWLRMTLRALPFMVGLRKPCRDFRNLPGAGQSEDAAC